jgi:bloom syndrome protein
VAPEDKTWIQKEWQKGNIKIVVATIAFGMGIDKPDVRFVIHHALPRSLEGYYQETGRAGRDGNSSDCILYFGYQDVTTLRKLIAAGDGSKEQKERQRIMLNKVASFCDTQDSCRRVAILRYFGETFNSEACNKTCDNCRNGAVFEQQDFTPHAVAVLEVVRAEKRLTINQCTDILLGKKNPSNPEALPESGYEVASSLKKYEIQRIIDRLGAEDALGEENKVMKKFGNIAIQYITVRQLPIFGFINSALNIILARSQCARLSIWSQEALLGCASFW